MFYNCHIHVFKDSDVPNKFLPLALVKILRTKLGFSIITRIFKRINPFKGKKKKLLSLLSKSKTPLDTKRKSRKELCSYFTDPTNYKYVINDFNSN